VKPFESVYQPASGFVTVTFLVPTAAPLESEMTTVSCVALLRVTELTVIPLPEKATLAPLTKPARFIQLAGLDRVSEGSMMWRRTPLRRTRLADSRPKDPVARAEREDA
jgi:hypothetical protein